MVHYSNQTVSIVIDESVTGTGNHFEFASGCSFIVNNCTFGSVVDCSITGDNNTVREGHGIAVVGKGCRVGTGCGFLMACEPTHPCEYLGDCRGAELRVRASKESASRLPQASGMVAVESAPSALSRPLPYSPQSILTPILERDIPRMFDVAWVTRLQKEYTEKMFLNDPYGPGVSERRKVPATLDPLRTRRAVTGEVLHAVCYVCKDICPTLSLSPCRHRNLCPQCAYNSYEGKYRLLHCPQCKREVTGIEFIAPSGTGARVPAAAPHEPPRRHSGPMPPPPPRLVRTRSMRESTQPSPVGRETASVAVGPAAPAAKRVRFAPLGEGEPHLV